MCCVWVSIITAACVLNSNVINFEMAWGANNIYVNLSINSTLW